jgi:hypothetical protein
VELMKKFGQARKNVELVCEAVEKFSGLDQK